MLGVERLRHGFCVGQLVVIVVLAFVADGIGLHGAAGHRGHGRDNRARVNPTAEECAQGHIADELHFHGFEELRADLLDPLCLAVLFGLAERHIPIFAVFDAALLHDQIVAREQLLDSFDEAERSGHVPEGKVFFQGGEVQAPRHVAELEDGLHLGGEEKPTGLAADVQWLFADAVAAQDEPFAVCVPQSESKHPAQPAEEIESLFLVEVNNDLGVRSCAEAVPFGFELLTKGREVIDFAVQDNPQGFVFIGDGLMAARNVNDAEAAYAEADAAPDVVTKVVWAAVLDDATHALEKRSQRRIRPIELRHSVDSTHKVARFRPKSRSCRKPFYPAKLSALRPAAEAASFLTPERQRASSPAWFRLV